MTDLAELDRVRARAMPSTTSSARGGPLVVAVDVGSSSIRAGLYDTGGRPVRGAYAQVAYEPDVDDRGGVQLPVERLLATLTTTLDALVARSAGHLSRVAGAGVSCFLHSVAAFDRDRRPISPLLSWADTTSAAAAADLRATLEPGAVWAETGAPLHASYWPAKILRLRSADAGAGARLFAGAPEILWHALTGQFGIDLSHASGTGLLDRASGGWHAGLLRALRLDPDALPQILPGAAAAPLAGWSAERYADLRDVPWFAPWSDAWCGNVGLGAVAGGPAALQVGTSGAIRVIQPGAAPPVPAGLFAHRLADGTSLLGGQLSEGGGVAAAVARLVGSTTRALERGAFELPADGHGLTILPFLAGERGTGYHERARGTVTGLGLGTTRAELYLATVEAIALRFAAIDRRLAAHLGHPPRIVASGGALARSELLAAVLAGALGRPFERSTVAEASARGAAIATLAAAGIIAGVAALPPPPGRMVVPDPDRVAAMRPAALRQEALLETLLGEA
ncbi:MAG: hypothetical protein H0V87_03605 [Chloroflexi bacterium]|nr:hypothetical protein [Chloroflexota bacterium]